MSEDIVNNRRTKFNQTMTTSIKILNLLIHHRQKSNRDPSKSLLKCLLRIQQKNKTKNLTKHPNKIAKAKHFINHNYKSDSGVIHATS